MRAKDVPNRIIVVGTLDILANVHKAAIDIKYSGTSPILIPRGLADINFSYCLTGLLYTLPLSPYANHNAVYVICVVFGTF